MKTTKAHAPRNTPRLTQIAALLATSSLAALISVPGYAQEAKPAADAAQSTNANDSVGLDRVVVTATSGQKSKMRSSQSVTDVDQEAIKNFGAHTEAEILLLIPGIRTDSTAGEAGNANITVRGLPIASGGSKYVQLQEDGLPTVQFGDMNFSNNDYWIRFDNNVDRIETLRGGASAVGASQAPGAVINYISKTGKEQGGEIGISRGLNYNQTRVDGDYGSHLAPDLYYHVGGYFAQGEGSHHTVSGALDQYQIKGNITKEFNGGKGYFRLNFKMLDGHAPTTFQTVLQASQTGNTISGFSKLPNYDATRDSQYSIYNASYTSVDPVTHAITNNPLLTGIAVHSTSVGAEFHNELANGFSVDDKFRISKNSGAFQTQFWNVMTLDKLLGGFATVANPAPQARYFNGPMAGQVVSVANLGTPGGLVSQGAAINTQTSDMGNLVNDLSLSKQFKLGDASSLDLHGGLYHMRQNVVQRWAISERVVQVGQNGSVIDVYNGAGGAAAALTTAGLTGYNNQWGACCARDINAQFTTDAPYLTMDLAAGNWDFDGGIRRESFHTNASYAGSKALTGGLDVNGDGVINGAETNVFVSDTAHPGLANYTVNYTNYSLGANYRITKDLSVFAHASKGNRAIADRLLFSANIDASTGALTSGGKTAALAPVKQMELGVKNKGKTGFGQYAVAATLFHSTTTEFDYDQTRQDNPNLPNYAGPKLNIVGYKSDGVEVESSLGFGNFSLNANLTYTKEVITTNLGAPQFIGKNEPGVPKLRYNITPTYGFGPLTVGATIRGGSSVWNDGGNTVSIDGHFVVNAFANYDFGNGLVATANVGNLFDKLYPVGSGGFVNGSSTVFGAGVETGRTITAGIKYRF